MVDVEGYRARNLPDRKQKRKRLDVLKNERSTWDPHWKDISEVLLPRAGRFFIQDRNKGHRRDHAIYDSTPHWSLQVQTAGLMAGAAPSTMPWIRMATADPSLNKFRPVKKWLYAVTERILRLFQKSNVYHGLHNIFQEEGAFGTGAGIIVPHPKNLIHLHPLTIGEYSVGASWDGLINTIYREFEMPVHALVEQFGLENCSQGTKEKWNRQHYDEWVPVCHAIEPRMKRDKASPHREDMAFESVYFELNGNDGTDGLLKVGGFREFPAVVPRWWTYGGDIYGYGPGMQALGDMRQLNHEQLQKGNAIDLYLDPSLQGPTRVDGHEIDSLPGGWNPVDTPHPNGGIKPLFEPNIPFGELRADLLDVQQRINRAMNVDMFLLLANTTNQERTKFEVSQLQEEKMLMLGPMLQRTHNELLEPLVDNAFLRLAEAGEIPPPPPDLVGHELNIEFVSLLAQAQQAYETRSTERWLGTVGILADFRRDVTDKVNADSIADRVADRMGVDPEHVHGGQQVAVVRKARADAQAAQAQIEAGAVQAKTMRDLAGVPTGGDANAANEALGALSAAGV